MGRAAEGVFINDYPDTGCLSVFPKHFYKKNLYPVYLTRIQIVLDLNLIIRYCAEMRIAVI